MTSNSSLTPNPVEQQNPLLQTARQDYASFYRIARPDDVAAMDALVLAESARPSLSDASSSTIPLRDRVRNCPSFVALKRGEKAEIERVLFGEVRKPLILKRISPDTNA